MVREATLIVISLDFAPLSIEDFWFFVGWHLTILFYFQVLRTIQIGVAESKYECAIHRCVET
jgi:hypothetical protein